MQKKNLGKSFLRAGWQRALLFLVVFLLLAAGLIIVFQRIVNKQSPDNPGADGLATVPSTGAMIAALFVISFGITYIFRRWIDKKSFISLGFSTQRRWREGLAGSMLAVFVIGASSLLLTVTGHLKWMDILFDPKNLFISFVSILLISFYQELIFRGYILNNLMDSMPKWAALAITSIVFTVVTGLNSQFDFFVWMNQLVMGAILGLHYMYTRNLWFSICFHAAWLFVQGPLLGFALQMPFQNLLQMESHGADILTGGINGLQGSIILLAVSLLSMVALFLFLQKKISQQSQPIPGRK